MKNKILKTITIIMAILAIVSASAVDSDSNIPLILLFASLLWMILFIYANRKSKALKHVLHGWE